MAKKTPKVRTPCFEKGKKNAKKNAKKKNAQNMTIAFWSFFDKNQQNKDDVPRIKNVTF